MTDTRGEQQARSNLGCAEWPNGNANPRREANNSMNSKYGDGTEQGRTPIADLQRASCQVYRTNDQDDGEQALNCLGSDY
jgi:hypothetical protein